MNTTLPVIVWFRKDLRLQDNAALMAAADHPIVPLFILDDNDPEALGGASRWWLYKSLAALQKSLDNRGLDLILRRGNSLEILQEIIAAHPISALYWNRCYEPYAIKRDSDIKAFFKSTIDCQTFNASLLVEPEKLKTQSGSPYRIFTPYWKAMRDHLEYFPAPLPSPENLKAYKTSMVSDHLEDWGLYPSPDWSQGLAQKWIPGEAGAHQRLDSFLEGPIDAYARDRDFPSFEGTSKLSPHLHWGEIGPRQVWEAALTRSSKSFSQDKWTFLSELAWREFSYYTLYHFPELPHQPLRPAFAHFPWFDGEDMLLKWQQGRTGYPIVDAGMRQLWTTGWMHNRVRMITASFLVKHLLIPWQKGADWFLDTLVDADLASNSLNWQWVAGCGIDAAPYFRIFNPVLQGEKFDSLGTYVREWVPEISVLPNKYIHKPWEAPKSVLESAGIQWGKTYSLPLIDHKEARLRALEAYSMMPR